MITWRDTDMSSVAFIGNILCLKIFAYRKYLKTDPQYAIDPDALVWEACIDQMPKMEPYFETRDKAKKAVTDRLKEVLQSIINDLP